MTTETVSPTTTSDERVVAALAHFFGLVVALIIWALYKDKSRFVRFQALQAVALDGLWMVLLFGLMMCWFGLMLLGGIVGLAAAASNPDSTEALAPIFLGLTMPWFMFACFAPLGLLYFVAKLVATVSVASGHDFHYPLLGKQVEAFLKNDQVRLSSE
jgi:uncharacterized membrane protein